MRRSYSTTVTACVFVFTAWVFACGLVVPTAAQTVACPSGSVASAGYCWVVNMGEVSATDTCARVGLTGSNGFVTGLTWTPAILADVSAKLGCIDAGKTGCCAQSMWRTASNNVCFTDNFSADVGGADFFNWSGQRLAGQFAVDACNGLPDADGDGVPDSKDLCPNTPAGEVVDANGCAISQLCPCANAWGNHGGYVSCVAHAADDFVTAGLITAAEKDAIVSLAGRSSCGKQK